MFAPGTLEAFGLYAVRTSVLVLASPILGEGNSFGAHKVSMIAILAVLLYSATGSPLSGPLSPPMFGALAMREVLIGLSLGIVLQVVVLAVRVAGELIGNEMAFNIASVVDPLTGVNTPLVTRIYEAMFLLGLLAVDGHHLILRALGDSFTRAPIGSVEFSSGAAGLVQDLFIDMFTAGISFAAPIVVLLLLVSVMIGLLSRAVPHLNILEIGFTLRIVMGLFAMLAFAPLLAPSLQSLYEHLSRGLDQMLVALEA